MVRTGGGRDPVVSWVSDPIRYPAKRRLRVLIYVRYSTQDQNPRSIDAQIEYCKRFLRALGIEDYELDVIQDVELSGELRSRPGIDQVWDGIRQRRWDLIVVEDASRIYRHDAWAVELVGLAYDKGIRTICVNDMIDTAEPVDRWHGRLKDATRMHAQTNWYTSHRIKRQLEYLWSIGAAVSGLRSGYRRTPTTPATQDKPAGGPYFDSIDEQWAPHIRCAFERIAADDPPWSVAAYVTENKVPKAANATLEEWSDETVKSMIRETLYRGFDVYRQTHSTSELTTGRKRPKHSEPSQVLTREMPYLRIVSDELWYQANAAIDARRPFDDYPSGPDNLMFRIPRDSRALLTKLAKCAICGAPMHRGGRGGRAYVCSAAQKRRCWNKATAEYALLETGAKDTARQQLNDADAAVDSFITKMQSLIGDREPLLHQIGRIKELSDERQKKIQRLLKLIENSDNPPQAVLDQIQEHERRLRKLGSKLARLERLESGAMIPNREEIENRVRRVRDDLDGDVQTASVALRKIIRRIDVIPFRQFGTNQVVTRARIVVDLAGLLSNEFRSVLSEFRGESIEDEFAPVTVMIDLFRPSTGPAYGLSAEALVRERGLIARQVAAELGITKRCADLAIAYGRALRAAGLENPFIELIEPPEKASHWGPHKKHRRPRKKSPRPADGACPTAAP